MDFRSFSSLLLCYADINLHQMLFSCCPYEGKTEYKSSLLHCYRSLHVADCEYA